MTSFLLGNVECWGAMLFGRWGLFALRYALCASSPFLVSSLGTYPSPAGLGAALRACFIIGLRRAVERCSITHPLLCGGKGWATPDGWLEKLGRTSRTYSGLRGLKKKVVFIHCATGVSRPFGGFGCSVNRVYCQRLFLSGSFYFPASHQCL